MIKTYRSLGFMEHYAYVKLPDRKEELSIPFTGGTKVPKRINGSYTTKNKAIQDALESHPAYGIDFVCVNSTTIESAAPTPELTPGVEPVPVVNFQQARKYLIDNHGVALADLPNKEALEKKAAELGVQFTY